MVSVASVGYTNFIYFFFFRFLFLFFLSPSVADDDKRRRKNIFWICSTTTTATAADGCPLSLSLPHLIISTWPTTEHRREKPLLLLLLTACLKRILDGQQQQQQQLLSLFCFDQWQIFRARSVGRRRRRWRRIHQTLYWKHNANNNRIGTTWVHIHTERERERASSSSSCRPPLSLSLICRHRLNREIHDPISRYFFIFFIFLFCLRKKIQFQSTATTTTYTAPSAPSTGYYNPPVLHTHTHTHTPKRRTTTQKKNIKTQQGGKLLTIRLSPTFPFLNPLTSKPLHSPQSVCVRTCKIRKEKNRNSILTADKIRHTKKKKKKPNRTEQNRTVWSHEECWSHLSHHHAT